MNSLKFLFNLNPNPNPDEYALNYTSENRHCVMKMIINSSIQKSRGLTFREFVRGWVCAGELPGGHGAVGG